MTLKMHHYCPPHLEMSKLRFREVKKCPVQGHTNIGTQKELHNHTKVNHGELNTLVIYSPTKGIWS